MPLATNDLVDQALPYIRNAVKLAQDDIKAELKRWEWVLVYPAWAVITGPLLRPLTRIGLEISFALTRAKGLPLVNGLVGFTEQVTEDYIPARTKQLVKEFRDLYAAPSSGLHPAVVDTINGRLHDDPDCLAGITL